MAKIILENCLSFLIYNQNPRITWKRYDLTIIWNPKSVIALFGSQINCFSGLFLGFYWATSHTMYKLNICHNTHLSVEFCLKWLSFTGLLHFYKRYVSALAVYLWVLSSSVAVYFSWCTWILHLLFLITSSFLKKINDELIV